MTKKRSFEEMEEFLNQYGFCLLETYYDKKEGTKVVLEDNNGYKYDSRFSDIANGHVELKIVGKHNPFSLKNISRWLFLENKNFILCDDNSYKNSKEKFSFKCLGKNCGEVFFARWNDIQQHKGCPFCSGKKTGKHNNLKCLRPDLEKDWDYETNVFSPDEVTEFSSKKANWICSKCGYKWKTAISGRSSGNGCPACAGKVVTDKNRLSILYPEIAAEWHPTLNGNLTPDKFSFSSGKYAWWVCKNGHAYYSTIDNRIHSSGLCKSCASSQKESNVATELKSYISRNYESKEEYRIFKNPHSGYYLPFDIYIFGGNNLKINGVYIEVHSLQHYQVDSWHILQSKENGTTPEEEFEHQIYRDKIKKNFAKKNGTYIEVDLRKIKTVQAAIEYIDKKLSLPE